MEENSLRDYFVARQLEGPARARTGVLGFYTGFPFFSYIAKGVAIILTLYPETPLQASIIGLAFLLLCCFVWMFSV